VIKKIRVAERVATGGVFFRLYSNSFPTLHRLSPPGGSWRRPAKVYDWRGGREGLAAGASCGISDGSLPEVRKMHCRLINAIGLDSRDRLWRLSNFRFNTVFSSILLIHGPDTWRRIRGSFSDAPAAKSCFPVVRTMYQVLISMWKSLTLGCFSGI